jgi:hypothetical protein
MRNRNEQRIDDIIKDLIKGSVVENKLLEAQLIEQWPTLVGELIAKHTQKIFINRQTLYLYIPMPALRNELNYSRDKIIDIVNRFAGCKLITEVKLLDTSK